jgi:hypothetical protein
MNSAWAMLVRLIAVKKRVMLRPKQRPAGSTSRHVRAAGAGRPVRTLRPTITTHHSTTEMSIRQNATTDPGVSDHLTSVELPEKSRTAATIARIPIGAAEPRRRIRRPPTTAPTVTAPVPAPVSDTRRAR